MAEIPELLVELSDPSTEVLSAIDRGAVPDGGPGSKDAVTIAAAWIEQLLAEEYQPPKDLPYFALRGDGKQKCDVVRIHFPAQDRDIQVAQTFCIFAATVRWPTPDGVKPEQHMVDVARRIMQDSERIDLAEPVTTGRFVFACQKEDEEKESLDFIDHLLIWTDGYRVGIATLKKQQPPGRAVMSWQRGFNLNWFGKYADAGQRPQ